MHRFGRMAYSPQYWIFESSPTASSSAACTIAGQKQITERNAPTRGSISLGSMLLFLWRERIQFQFYIVDCETKKRLLYLNSFSMDNGSNHSVTTTTRWSTQETLDRGQCCSQKRANRKSMTLFYLLEYRSMARMIILIFSWTDINSLNVFIRFWR